MMKRLKQIGAFRYWVRSVRACEGGDYEDALSQYSTFHSVGGKALPYQRAFEANLLILASRHDEAGDCLQSLISDLDGKGSGEWSVNETYSYEFARMLKAMMDGSEEAEVHKARAAKLRPSSHVVKLLPL